MIIYMYGSNYNNQGNTLTPPDHFQCTHFPIHITTSLQLYSNNYIVHLYVFDVYMYLIGYYASGHTYYVHTYMWLLVPTEGQWPCWYETVPY